MSTGHYLVTGGGGFVGKALCQELIESGNKVTALSRSVYPELVSLGVNSIAIDLTSPPENFSEYFKDVSGVFHVAAKVDMWGSYQDFYNVNVGGTKAVLAACIAAKVPRLVYTSSPSVIAREYDLKNVDESISYPESYLSYYPQTKAEAEKIVLKANCESLYTLSLRPHLIWGPGDTNLIPTVLEKAKKGKLMKIGAGNNLVDFSYIKDCVSAHIAAMEALGRNPASRGKAFFISQDEPYSLWGWIDRILEANHYPRVTKMVSYKLARHLAGILEFACRMAPVFGTPRITKFLVDQMSHDHYFNINAAKEVLGYKPKYTMEQALVEYLDAAR